MINRFCHKIVITVLGWLLVAAHFFIFKRFIPNASGGLGHDYDYNLPLLLDGYYWFLNNGLFSVPWFTPSFCGGVPLIGNPATFYFSAAQFLTFLVDPLTAVRLTFFLFAALGFWGFYFLLQRLFKFSEWTSLLGGALFLFNGLYVYRFIVGHMEFHGFMLVPLIAFLLIRPESTGDRFGKWHAGASVLGAALLLGYMFWSGMAQLIIPSMLAVIVIGLLYGVVNESGLNWKWFWGKLGCAVLFSLCLSAAKLVAALSFLGNFPRDSYLLPGVAGIFKLLLLLGQVLSLGGEGVNSGEVLSNFQWYLDRHEFEYSISVVPFVLITIGIFQGFRKRAVLAGYFRKPWNGVSLCLIIALLLVPLVLNYYTPQWNQILKAVPGLRNLSNFLRWFCIFIPIFILLAAIVVEKTDYLKQYCRTVALIGIGLLIGQTMLTDRAFYQEQGSDPVEITEAYRRIKAKGNPPTISQMVVYYNADGKPDLMPGRNKALIDGQSQLLCYEPMFGFRLEFFPFQSIHPGPALEVSNNRLNLKNPACYLYPEENQCSPGDHFRVDQITEAVKFINFRPFAYKKSTAQKMADILNCISFLAAGLFGVLYIFSVIRSARDEGITRNK